MFAKDTKILVADDMSTMRRIVKNSLGDLGYTNTVDAKNGKIAWDALEQANDEDAPVGLILCDWNMPECTGLELLKMVRDDDRFKSLPFIMLTAKSEASDISEAEEVGVSGYLTKPFATVELEAKMQEVFESLAA